MNYKPGKGQADETTKGKKPPDEYTKNYKVEFDQKGTADTDATDIDDLF
jgi:hypothetical protein